MNLYKFQIIQFLQLEIQKYFYKLQINKIKKIINILKLKIIIHLH